ncbi:MAG: tRNA pseudouridine(55) synthase TruB [Betaproteobacteria bacterium HGW-Betaproteobacteria-11]|nr:MAG: tRNA pseudouridine(55) synthase TruB [Betaproteobacteria bacterium HGW-Betaproteobacteria-11]
MITSQRSSRRLLDGVLILDKALGLSSNHTLQAARRLYNAEKAGHTGTLDPLATGLLPLCFGEATKFSAELLEADKRYIATVQLGVTTTTADAEGAIVERRSVAVDRDAVEATLASFLGEIDQVPPMYSALKREGKPLYEYARAGLVVERKVRHVRIHEIRLLSWSGDRFVFEVSCSKGTYIRTLAVDLGERLGCGAFLAGLRRTGIGNIDISQAHAMEDLERLSPGDRDAILLPPDALLAALEAVVLETDDALRMRQGQLLDWEVGKPGQRLRIYDESGSFIGVAQVLDEGRLRPLRLVATNRISMCVVTTESGAGLDKNRL